MTQTAPLRCHRMTAVPDKYDNVAGISPKLRGSIVEWISTGQMANGDPETFHERCSWLL